jgi:hemerythrin-like domain-containing protein
MQARGQLMVEHRLIERMIRLIEGIVAQIESTGEIDPVLIEAIIDFIRSYADQTHHGKEEDILFRELDKKNLSAKVRQVMNELTEEHVIGRKTTKVLADANIRYRNGDPSSLSIIAEQLKAFIDLYPQHMEKEDKFFFPASLAYFTDEEDQAMLAEFLEFDREMIQEKYKGVITELKDKNDEQVRTSKR